MRCQKKEQTDTQKDMSGTDVMKNEHANKCRLEKGLLISSNQIDERCTRTKIVVNTAMIINEIRS